MWNVSVRSCCNHNRSRLLSKLYCHYCCKTSLYFVSFAEVYQCTQQTLASMASLPIYGRYNERKHATVYSFWQVGTFEHIGNGFSYWPNLRQFSFIAWLYENDCDCIGSLALKNCIPCMQSISIQDFFCFG